VGATIYIGNPIWNGNMLFKSKPAPTKTSEREAEAFYIPVIILLYGTEPVVYVIFCFSVRP
jgi:hypothetical protein